jgi:hypothetical protein
MERWPLVGCCSGFRGAEKERVVFEAYKRQETSDEALSDRVGA